MTTTESDIPGGHEPEEGRLLGSARTAAERDVEEVLGSVAQWRGNVVRYAPVTGGLQNSNWRVTVAGSPKSYFLKIPGAGSEAYVDRLVTNEVGSRAGRLGIGPEVVHFDPVSGVEIIEYLDGYRACTNGDLKREDVPRQIVELYRCLHGSGQIGAVKTIFDMIDEHREQVADLAVTLPPDWPVMVREYRAARAAVFAAGLDLVPCHNDPMPGNFLYREGAPLKLIDYEFASDNDRAYELAMLATEMFFDERRMQELIEDYYGRLEFATLARVQVFSALADVKWGLWGCINKKTATSWDFDYHKYGVWKLMRARLKMSDPRWGLWLASV